MPAEELKCHSTLRSACDAGLSSALNGGSNSDETNPIVAAAIVVGLLLIMLLSKVFYHYYEKYEDEKFARIGGPAALEAANLTLPGLTRAEPGRKALPPVEAVASRPNALVDARKPKDFWGLQSVPEVALSGVRTIDKIVCRAAR